MKKPSRFLRIVGVLGLLGTIVAALIGPAATASAQTALPLPFDPEPIFNFDDPGFTPETNVIYYPWVANDDESTGLGPADTSITVQNLEWFGTQIYIFKGVGDGSWEYVTTAALASWASKTFSAADLDIAEGEGAPIAVAGFAEYALPDDDDDDNGDAIIEVRETPVLLSKPTNVEGDSTQVTVCVAYNILLDEEDEEYTELWGFEAATGFTSDFSGAEVTYAEGDWVDVDTQAQLQEILNDANPPDPVDPSLPTQLIDPFGGLNADGDCTDYIVLDDDDDDDTVVISATLGGVAKQAVDGENLPYTSSADTAVSGYNAFNQFEIASFDDWYLPIVQTNCGPGGCWNSILRVANLGNLNNAVTVRFFPADDGSGSLQTGFQLESLVDGGDVWTVDISDWVPEGWVGSAHIYSDGAVFAMVDRVKVGYNMWLTTTGSSAPAEAFLQVPGGSGNYVLFAPDVRLDFYGWNTGINVANLADASNNVNVQYFGQFGGTTQNLTQQLAPQGMTYFYDPSIGAQDNSNQDPTDDPNADLIGSALIWSDYPVAVAVDATKYPESTTAADANVFQGFTYNATANIYNWQFVPLVQKGNPTTGMGATSGVQIFNPNATATTADVYWVNQSGFQADNNGISSLAIPPYANGFVYTMTQHNLPNGFYGSAVVNSTWPVLALSTNVDYQVQFDGSASWLAFNPCGFYRAPGDCFVGPPFGPETGADVTKTFVDEAGEPVAGVEAALVPTGSDLWYGTGVSSVDGEISWSNVPPGEYSIFVLDVPQWDEDDDADDDFMYEFDPEVAADGPFTLVAGDSYEVTNTLVATDGPDAGAGRLTKVLVLPADIVAMIEAGDLSVESVVSACSVEDYLGEDDDGTDDGCDDAENVFAGGVADADIFEGYGPDDEAAYAIYANVPAGDYVICSEFSVSGDFDDDDATDDDTLTQEFRCESESDDQVVLDEFGAATSTGEAATGPITVYEDMETRVFNFFNPVGLFDVFVRDDESDLAIPGAEVCVYTAEHVLIECATTTADGPDDDGDGVPDTFGGYATFELVAGTYVVNAQAEGYEGESQTVAYDVFVDAANGGLDDTDTANGASADAVSALDPAGAVLDVQTLIGAEPINGITVSLYAASPLDDPATGFCGSTELLALVTSASDTDEGGAVTEGVAEFRVAPGDYCAQATIAGTLVAGVGTADVDDTDGDIDISLSAAFDPATQGVLDVTVVAAAVDLQSGVHTVEIYVAAADTAGSPGTCAGALVTSGSTAPNAAGDGEIDFILAAGTYCVAADSADGLGSDPTVTTGVTLAAGDLAGDVDVTMFTT